MNVQTIVIFLLHLTNMPDLDIFTSSFHNLQITSIFFFSNCQAQPQLNSTQSQLNLRLRWSLFLFDPATHHIDSATDPPAGKVSFETGKESNMQCLSSSFNLISN